MGNPRSATYEEGNNRLGEDQIFQSRQLGSQTVVVQGLRNLFRETRKVILLLDQQNLAHFLLEAVDSLSFVFNEGWFVSHGALVLLWKEPASMDVLLPSTKEMELWLSANTSIRKRVEETPKRWSRAPARDLAARLCAQRSGLARFSTTWYYSLQSVSAISRSLASIFPGIPGIRSPTSAIR
jgi:hypothetical protein